MHYHTYSEQKFFKAAVLASHIVRSSLFKQEAFYELQIPCQNLYFQPSCNPGMYSDIHSLLSRLLLWHCLFASLDCPCCQTIELLKERRYMTVAEVRLSLCLFPSLPLHLPTSPPPSLPLSFACDSFPK